MEILFLTLPVMAFLVIIVTTVAFFAARYKRCPSDMILVVYGKVGKGQSAMCIHGGAKLILPLLQDYRFMSLVPLTIAIPLKDALSLQNIRINVPSTFTVGISTDPAIMNNAAERLLGLERKDVEHMAREIIFGQLRLTVASLTIEQINQDRERFLSAVRDNVSPELNKIGLYLINVNITDITDESNYIDSIVVYGQRTFREGETRVKLLTASLFYRVLQRVTNVDIPSDVGDFRLLSRRAVHQLKTMREKDRFVRGMVSWIGFRQTGVEYRRDVRLAGETKYPLGKMTRFALDGVTSFSTAPLRVATWFGYAASGLAFFYLLSVPVQFVLGITVPGFSTIMVALLFLGGTQLICIGILGEYIGRIFNEVKGRPLYIVEQVSGVGLGDSYGADRRSAKPLQGRADERRREQLI